MTRARTVLVTGATGRVGSLVVDDLLRAGARVRALARQPDRAEISPGAEIATGDLTVPESLDGPLENVDAVFLVWTAPIATAAAVIERVAEQPSGRPRRVVYLSAPHRTPHPFFQQPNPLRDLHGEVERLLASATTNRVVLRPGMFASNALHWWAPQIRNGDVVRWPYGAAETAPVDERDIAAVAARSLLDDRHAGGDYVLTGSESLSQAHQVHAIGDAIGRPLRFEELSADEFRRETAGTWPASTVNMLLDAWHATLGVPAYVTSTIQEILGSPPRTFRQWAADNASAFHRLDRSVELRAPATAQEWAAYHAIRRRVLFELRGNGAAYDEHHPDDTRAGHHPFVLWADDTAVGAIRVDIDGTRALFRRVAIHDDFQRRGYGRRLLDAAERFAREQRCTVAESYVDAGAVGFYERCGFSNAGPAGSGSASPRMIKALAPPRT